MINRGKLAILTIVGIAILASCLSVWWHYRMGRRTREFWGIESALLIRHAPKVEVLQLVPADASLHDESEKLTLDGVTVAVIHRKDISQARGLVHVRNALVEDASFGWQKPLKDCNPVWQRGLRFSDSEKTATIVLDFSCGRIALADGGRVTGVNPKILAGLRKFTTEQLENLKSQDEGVVTVD